MKFPGCLWHELTPSSARDGTGRKARILERLKVLDPRALTPELQTQAATKQCRTQTGICPSGHGHVNLTTTCHRLQSSTKRQTNRASSTWLNYQGLSRKKPRNSKDFRGIVRIYLKEGAGDHVDLGT